MANRTFRARNLDVKRPLDIIRDETLLDSTEGLPAREIAITKPEVEADGEKHKTPPKDTKPAKEIPIPGVYKVSSYEVLYLPTFKERNTYLRGRGGKEYDDPTLVEYDLDAEDEQWLKEFNGEQERLSLDKFEAMLWKLDVANAEATDKVFSFQGGATAERLTEEACSTTDHFRREDALQMLEESCPSRDTIRVAVYEYWLKKRERLRRPLIRRLEAPTPHSNCDPLRAFRPREKPHRPQTRRRRENNPDSHDKLALISENMRMAQLLFELIYNREKKKRDIVYVMTDWQQLQIKQRHEPRAQQEAIEQEYLAAAKNKVIKRPVGFEHLPEATQSVTNTLLSFRSKKNKKRKKGGQETAILGQDPLIDAVSYLPPPPIVPQNQMLCIWAPPKLKSAIDEEKIKLPAESKKRLGARWASRMGRGGRLIFDRCRPFTMDPLDEEEDEVKPLHELPNPYEKWGTKNELASAAMARLDGNGTPAAAPSTIVRLRVTNAAVTPSNGQQQETTPEAAGGSKRTRT